MRTTANALRDPRLDELIELARRRGPMTEQEQRKQVISFAYGNLKLSGWQGTVEDVALAYDLHVAQEGGEG